MKEEFDAGVRGNIASCFPPPRAGSQGLRDRRFYRELPADPRFTKIASETGAAWFGGATRARLLFSGYFFAAARFAAHIFLVAAIIAAIPAALSFRFAFGAAFEVGVAVGVADAWGAGLPFMATHRLRWASAMALRPAALTFGRAGFSGAGVRAGSAGFPDRNARSSAI